MDFTRQRRLSTLSCTLLTLVVGTAAVHGQQNNQQQPNQQQNQTKQDPTQPGQATQPDKQSGQPEDQQQSEKKPEPRQLRVFELQHRNPAEIQQLLGMRSAPGGISQGGNVARAARPADLEEGPMAAVASDADSKSLFVRGTAEQIQKIEGIVKVVDVPADQFQAQTIGDKHVIPISGDGNRTQRVLQTLSQLQLPHQVVQVGGGALVVISDDGSGEFQSLAEQAQQVIAALQKSQPQEPASTAAPQQNQNPQGQNTSQGASQPQKPKDGGEKKQ